MATRPKGFCAWVLCVFVCLALCVCVCIMLVPLSLLASLGMLSKRSHTDFLFWFKKPLRLQRLLSDVDSLEFFFLLNEAMSSPPLTFTCTHSSLFFALNFFYFHHLSLFICKHSFSSMLFFSSCPVSSSILTLSLVPLSCTDIFMFPLPHHSTRTLNSQKIIKPGLTFVFIIICFCFLFFTGDVFLEELLCQCVGDIRGAAADQGMC